MQAYLDEVARWRTTERWHWLAFVASALSLAGPQVIGARWTLTGAYAFHNHSLECLESKASRLLLPRTLEALRCALRCGVETRCAAVSRISFGTGLFRDRARPPKFCHLAIVGVFRLGLPWLIHEGCIRREAHSPHSPKVFDR